MRVRTEEQKAAHREWMRQWRIRNPSQARAKNLANYSKNKDKVRESQADYYQRNKETIRARTKAYRLANREKDNAAHAKWRARNRARVLELRKASRAADPDRHKEYGLKWRRQNKGKVVAATRRRQISKIRRTPAWADHQEIDRIYAECARISLETGVQHHVDHIIPLNGELVSGLHVPENLQVLAAIENIKKGNRHAERGD